MVELSLEEKLDKLRSNHLIEDDSIDSIERVMEIKNLDEKVQKRLAEGLMFTGLEESAGKVPEKTIGRLENLLKKGGSPETIIDLIEGNAENPLSEREWARIQSISERPMMDPRAVELELSAITDHRGDDMTQEYARRLSMAHSGTQTNFDSLSACVDIRSETGKKEAILSTEENACYEAMAAKGFKPAEITQIRREHKERKFELDDFKALFGEINDPAMSKQMTEEASDAYIKRHRFSASEVEI